MPQSPVTTQASSSPETTPHLAPSTKERFTDFCNDVGLSASSVITVYINTVIRENRIPFIIEGTHTPNAETIAAMREGDRIAHDPNWPRYTLEEALAELKR